MTQNLPLIILAVMTLLLASDGWRLWRHGRKPLSRMISALVTAVIIAVIPVWNTTAPVWVWWLFCALLGAVVGLAVWRIMTARNHTVADDSVIMER